MPVKSLNSSILNWPDHNQVINELIKWSDEFCKDNNILKIGYYGSYSTLNYGVGSDLDIIVILKETDIAYIRRPTMFDLTSISVPTDIVVYTEKEWNSMKNTKFYSYIINNAKWIK